MRSRRWPTFVALVLMVSLVLPAGFVLAGRLGGGDTPQPEPGPPPQCAAARARLVLALDQYVARFTDADVFGPLETPLPDVVGLRTQAAGVLDQAERLDCDPDAFADDALAGLTRLTGDGLLGEAVASLVSANVRDVFRPGRVARRVLGPGDDLADTVASLPLGGTVVLPPSEVRVDRPVIVLQDVTIVGAGSDRSHVASSAAQGVIVQIGPGLLRLEGLAVEAVGTEPSSLLVLRTGRADLLDVTLTGARASAATAPGEPQVALGGGGTAVLSVGADEVTLRESRLAGNQVAGLVAAGDVDLTVRDATVSGSSACGLCFLGEASGSVRGARVRGNGVGVVVGERAHPVLADTAITGNTRGGVLVEARARPTLRGSRIAGNGRLGVAVYGTSAPRIVGNRISGHTDSGVVVDVGGRARPLVSRNRFAHNDQAALAFLGSSRGAARGNHCTGGTLQVVLDGTARPTLVGNSCALRDQRG